jgi:hypothetical protein
MGAAQASRHATRRLDAMPRVFKPRPPSSDSTSRRFKNAGEAAKEVHTAYNDWTSSLGKHGLQLTFALMAANWALHGTTKSILDDWLSTASMLIALAYLTAFLSLTYWLVHEHRKCHDRTDADKVSWAKEFQESASSKSSWPYTKRCETLGDTLHFLHFAAPVSCGALLVMSVFWNLYVSTPSPAPSACTEYSCAASGACCGEWRKTEPSSFERVQNSGRPIDSITAQASQTVQAPPLLLMIATATFAVGLAFAVRSRRPHIKAAGAALATVGALTLSAGGFTLIKELKIDSLVTIKTDRLFDLVQQEVRRTSGRLERVVSIDGFALGDSVYLEREDAGRVPASEAVEVRKAARLWMEQRRNGFDGVLIVIGSADRLRLSGAKDKQFEANMGLARARAEVIRAAILKAIHRDAPDLEPRPEQVLVLVSGPQQTPDSSRSTPASWRSGFPEDRRVEVWGFWTLPAPRL